MSAYNDDTMINEQYIKVAETLESVATDLKDLEGKESFGKEIFAMTTFPMEMRIKLYLRLLNAAQDIQERLEGTKLQNNQLAVVIETAMNLRSIPNGDVTQAATVADIPF